MNVNLIVLEVHSESCSLQCSINADLHKCSANSLHAPVYIYVSSDIKNSNCINVNYTWRGGCPNKIEVHNTDCQRLCEIYRHFILLLLHNCPKCNAVFFSSNKTAPIGGHRQAGCWFGRSHCPLLTVIRICRLCGKMPNSWNDTDDFRKHLKHRDFVIDNRCCTKRISNKCRQRGGRAARKCQACCPVEEKNWSSQIYGYNFEFFDSNLPSRQGLSL